MTVSKNLRHSHRMPLGEDRILKKLRGFVKRQVGEPMKQFRVINSTIIEYKTQSGVKGLADIYQDSLKKWKFRAKERE